MSRLLGFLSPWTLAAIAVWLVVMVIAYNWAVPIYAKIGGPRALPGGGAKLLPETFTVTQPDTTIFAIIVTSIVTAVLAGVAVLFRREASRPR